MNNYQRLNDYKKAYVVCAVGQKYIDSTKYLIEGLSKYSIYPVILYYGDGTVNYSYDNLILQPMRVASRKIDQEHGPKFMTTLKGEVTSNCLKNYNIDTLVMLDSDIVVTPAIDNIFKEYGEAIENYPIFIRYTWNIITVMGRPHVSELIKDTIGISNPMIPAICSCTCIANRNCMSYLEDWKHFCEDDALIKYHYEDHKDVYYDFNDESIANALLWKYKATKVLDCNFMWAINYPSVQFAFDFYDKRTNAMEIHTSYPSHYRVPPEYEVPTGLSVLPQLKRNLWGFHGPKDIEQMKLIVKEIDERF